MKPSNICVWHLFRELIYFDIPDYSNGLKRSVKNFKSDKTNVCKQFRTTQKSVLIIIQHNSRTYDYGAVIVGFPNQYLITYRKLTISLNNTLYYCVNRQ